MRKISKFILPVLFITASIGFTACKTEKVAVQPESPVVVEESSPGPNYSMRGPEWKWDATNKTYVYVAPEYQDKPNGVWVRGHWREVKGGYSWVPGYWK